jgi:hypothetical protein
MSSGMVHGSKRDAEYIAKAIAKNEDPDQKKMK